MVIKMEGMVQFCSSRGYLLKSIMHAAVVVILRETETAQRLRHEEVQRKRNPDVYVRRVKQLGMFIQTRRRGAILAPNGWRFIPFLYLVELHT
ncbi:hypothetical protein EYF80_003031 [Liparis tanakae]|uniref:Uncharacterized protein n=1 Tax=Liparis tanakae TaxID=230148 RepID=A0A4Z2JB02_9TELE|nr:hypothetical protein EYF80_003031 [Liparis tanakae]